VVKWGNDAAAKPRSLHRKCYTAALVWRSRSISSLFCFVLFYSLVEEAIDLVVRFIIATENVSMPTWFCTCAAGEKAIGRA
jgi:hypothetical protein